MCAQIDLQITPYVESRHRRDLRACLIELQDFERSLDPRMPKGAAIATAYVQQMLVRVHDCQGQIFVAESHDQVLGYATILATVQSDEIEDGGLVYGLLSDLMVREQYRGNGIGRVLLDACERYARSQNVEHLRIGVLAANETALSLYRSRGYAPLYTELEKALGAGAT